MQLDIYTDGSGRDVKKKDGTVGFGAGWGMWGFKEGNEKDCFYGYGPVIGNNPTNNQGEMKAALYALNTAISMNASRVNVYTDSMYVLEPLKIGMSNWISRGWKTSTGEPVKNQELWKELLIAIGSLKKKNVEVSYRKVKAHSGIHGNEMADMYAKKGAGMAYNDNTDPVFGYGDEKKQKEEVKPVEENTKKEKPTKAPLKEPLIVGTRVFALSNTAYFYYIDENNVTQNVYYSSKYPSDSKVLDRECGVENSDSLMCVTIDSKPVDFQLAALKPRIDRLKSDGLVFPVVIYWDKLSSGPMRQRQHEEGKDFKLSGSNLNVTVPVVQKDKTTKLDVESKMPVARLAKTPRRTWCMFEYMEAAFFNLSSFLEGKKKEEDVVDITDYFIAEAEDKKGKVKREIAKRKNVTFIDVKAFDKTIRLTSNIEIPALDRLGGILKAHPDVRIYIVRHNVSSHMYRYSVIFKGNTANCITFNPYTNIIYTRS